MPLEFLFGRRKTPEEILKQNQRALNKVKWMGCGLCYLVTHYSGHQRTGP